MCCSSSSCYRNASYSTRCRCICARCRACDFCGGDGDGGVAELITSGIASRLAGQMANKPRPVPDQVVHSGDLMEDMRNGTVAGRSGGGSGGEGAVLVRAANDGCLLQ